jgi:hypothetical protein
MTWQAPQAIHIFAPPEEPYGDNWVEQILGTVIRPLFLQYQDDLKWLWVTRYGGSYSDAAPPLGYPIPERYHSNGWYRYIVVRFSAQDEVQQSIQNEALRLAQEANCFPDPRGWIDYDIVADLGGDRFVRAEAGSDDRQRRSQLVANFMDATVRMILDALGQDSTGRWILEPNINPQNPNGSFFESVHHVFCNATAVPTTVLLSGRANQWQIQTFWMSQPAAFTVDTLRGFQGQIPVQY